MSTQNYQNHSRYVPLYHFVTLGAIVALLIGSFVNLSKSTESEEGIYSTSLICLVAVILLALFFFCRLFSLRAQDRAIRAEENFRHYILTGKPCDKRLRMSQIIALRFAPDEEMPSLAERAVNENLSSKQIKQAVKNWKPDHHRA